MRPVSLKITNCIVCVSTFQDVYSRCKKDTLIIKFEYVLWLNVSKTFPKRLQNVSKKIGVTQNDSKMFWNCFQNVLKTFHKRCAPNFEIFIHYWAKKNWPNSNLKERKTQKIEFGPKGYFFARKIELRARIIMWHISWFSMHFFTSYWPPTSCVGRNL